MEIFSNIDRRADDAGNRSKIPARLLGLGQARHRAARENQMTNLRHGQQQAKTALRVRADGVGVVVKLEPLFGKRESCPE